MYIILIRFFSVASLFLARINVKLTVATAVLAFTCSLEKTHLTLIQRCALTVQLQPFMAHIPGGLVASTMHGRNARYHRRNTEHTIPRSHLIISPSRALNTLRLALIATIFDRTQSVRSSPVDFLARSLLS